MDPQSADVHACKVRRRHSDCSNLGSTTAKDCCQDLRGFAEESHDILEQVGEDVIENIDDFVGKLHAYLVSFTTDAPNRIVEKEMVWKRGADCTVSTIRYHP